MKNWYFTFGFAHTTKDGVPLRDFYVKIPAKTMMEAREKMFSVRDAVWSFQYTEEEFLPQIEKYGLSEISLEECR